MHFLNILITFWLICIVHCWDTEEMEIFDLVEEINENFYDVMGINQDANLSEIKKAYRSLSKKLHPDKNDAADAEIKFRQLVAIYDVLRDDGRRARYDRVLVEGLPDWRSPIFYYRRARKMSMLEIILILTGVISITQYLMAWGTYWDKKHTQEEILLKKYKIKDGKKKKSEDLENLSIIESELNKIERPRWWNVLPIQVIQLIIFLITNGPSIVRSLLHDIKERKRLKEEEEQFLREEEERLKEEEERKKEKKAQNKVRKRVTNLPDLSNEKTTTETKKKKRTLQEEIPVIVGGPWTDEDFSELARLMAKYPGGTPERWEKIASHMSRTVYKVTKMSTKVKVELANRNISVDPTENKVEVETEVKVKVKTRGGKADTEKMEASLCSDEYWSIMQQKALEKALKAFPKGCDQRWDKIARCVPDKSKDDCMMRFKYLAEKIRKKKEEQKQEEEENEDHIQTLDNKEIVNNTIPKVEEDLVNFDTPITVLESSVHTESS